MDLKVSFTGPTPHTSPISQLAPQPTCHTMSAQSSAPIPISPAPPSSAGSVGRASSISRNATGSTSARRASQSLAGGSGSQLNRRPSRAQHPPMAPIPPPRPLTHDEALEALRSFLKERSSYDVFPVSFRLIVLDTQLKVKKALDVMLLYGER